MENNQETQEEKKIPIGLQAREGTIIEVPVAEFIHLMQLSESLSKYISYVKQKNINNDVFRYYFQSDLEPLKDDKGNPLYTKTPDGKEVPQHKLRDNFWE